jgi:hypothetical protein
MRPNPGQEACRAVSLLLRTSELRYPVFMADKHVIVASFPTPHEAQLAKMQLESADIPAYVSDEMTVGMVWHMGTALGGVKLHVAEADAQRAEAILSGSDPTDKADHPLEATPYRKHGRSEQDLDGISPTRHGDDAARRAFRAAIVGLFLCPGVVHIYSIGLVLSARSLKLSASGRRNLIAAASVDAAVLVTIVVLIALKL